MGMQPSVVSTTLHCVLLVNFLKVHFVSPCKLLMKMVHSNGSCIDMGGVPLMTDFQLDLVLPIHNCLLNALEGYYC